MNNNKEEYYKHVKELSTNNLAREVFFDENISILNVAEDFYLVNYIENNTKTNLYITGFMATSKMIDYVSNGLEYYYNMVKALKENQKAQVVKLDSQTIEHIKQIKINTLKTGPSKYINYEMEEKLMNKMKERQGRGR